MALASKIAHGSSHRARRCRVRTGKLATLGRWASSSTALSLDSTTAANRSPMTASCCCSMPITNPLSSVCRPDIRSRVEHQDYNASGIRDKLHGCRRDADHDRSARHGGHGADRIAHLWLGQDRPVWESAVVPCPLPTANHPILVSDARAFEVKPSPTTSPMHPSEPGVTGAAREWRW